MKASETTYAVIMQYPGDGRLEENRVRFFSNLDKAIAFRNELPDRDWYGIYVITPAAEAASAR